MVLILRKARLLLGKTAVAAWKNRQLLRLRRRRLLMLLRDGRGPGILLQVRRLPGAGFNASV